MAQATWSEITKRQSIRAPAYLPAWAMGGCGLVLLVCGIVAASGAYDSRAAIARLLAVATGVTLCWAATLIAQTESRSLPQMRVMEVSGFIAAISALLIGLYFLWRSPANGGPYAGALVALLPVALVTLLHGQRWSARRMGTPAELVSWAGLALGGLALVYSGERSALLALALGAAFAVTSLWLSMSTRYWLWILAGLGVLAALAMFVLYVAGFALPALLADRLVLWRDAMPLIGDYRFTGVGPANTEMMFASYALLTHVPYVAQLHNLFLEVALEFGAFGLAALLGMFAAALVAALQALRYGAGATRRRAAAVLAALMATLLLGLVDAEVVASPLIVTIFVPLAAALLVQTTARAEAHNGGILEFPARSAPAAEWSSRPVMLLLVCAVGIVPVLVMWGINARPRIQAAWEVNQGAVMQGQIELTNYAQAPWPFQDAIRRTRADALLSAENAYKAALFLDPAQETAHRRMGQISLSLGDVNRAAIYLQEAHRLDPQNRVSAQLLGEVRALQGNPAAAAALWQPLTMAHNQLETRLNRYRGRGDADGLARMEEAVVLYNQSVSSGATQ